MIKTLLAHPLSRGLDLDDPRMTVARKRIIREKPFLRSIYEEWYQWLASVTPDLGGPVLELGSGAGFLKERIPGLVTSDVLNAPDMDLVLDGRHIPVRGASLSAIVMVDVLHHIPQPEKLFSEAARCVKSRGVMAMIEPWVTPWSSLVFRNLHHEPFQPEAEGWEFPESGPLSGANEALPWIIFERDRPRFAAEFPQWRIKTVELDMPFSYLLSGGVSMRALAPGWAFGPARWLERLMKGWSGSLAMFARILLERV